MKRFEDFKDLNYLELSFFAGISIEEAKFDIAAYKYYGDIEFTLNGDPIISKKDKLPVKYYDFTWKTNTSMGDVNKMKMICDSYNKGVSLSKLKEFADNKEFIRKGKFTGRYEVLNDILNRNQLEQLQERWNSYER